MKILVLNCGSSSIKYQLLEVEGEANSTLLAKGLVERVGQSEGRLVHKPVGKDIFELKQPIADHTSGISLILDALVNPVHGVISSVEEIAAAGHRVAHGGEFFTESALIDEKAKAEIESLFDLAPLHNPPALKGVLAIEEILPAIKQVAVFDTSFHSSMPKKNFVYGIPYEYYEKLRIRRYGFHGTSHKFVAKKACGMTGLDFDTAKVITCHIGNGASITAIKDGKSVNTSMGFTPVDGLVMGTRCGEVDPSALLYIMDKEGVGADRIGDIINKESGLLGVSGVSSDMRDVIAAMNEGNERAQLIFDMFNSRLRRYIGAYMAELGGADVIVFTGGIGENEEPVRRDVMQGLEALGIHFDDEANWDNSRGESRIISKENSPVKVVIASTDEELVIATDTYDIVSAL
ncbi:MAG: acetate kinase [Rikenellaceae bacterium]